MGKEMREGHYRRVWNKLTMLNALVVERTLSSINSAGQVISLSLSLWPFG